MKYPNERYFNDYQFRALVDNLYMQIKNTNFTPTEIREAAMLAQIKYETEYPRPITVAPDLLEELNKNSKDWKPE